MLQSPQASRRISSAFLKQKSQKSSKCLLQKMRSVHSVQRLVPGSPPVSTSATQKPRSQRPASTSGIKSPRHTTKQLHTISYRLHGWKRKVIKKCVFRAFRANVISSRSTPINVAMLSPKAKEFVPRLPTAENSRALRSKYKTNL